MHNLHSLQAEVSGLSEKREVLYEARYQEAVRCFQDAARSDYEDKQALELALKSFAELIQVNPEDDRPYLFSGYLLFLMGAHADAKAYLTQAQTYNPEAQEADFLLQALEKAAQEPQFQAYQQELPPEKQTASPEAIWNEFTHLVQQELKFSLNFNLRSEELVVDTEAYQQLKAHTSRLQKFLNQLQGPLEFLHSHYPALTIEKCLQPLTQQNQALSLCYERSAPFVSLKRELKRATKESSDLVKKIRQAKGKEQAQSFDLALENLYQQCDGFADRLDGFANQGYDISELEQAYERLLKFVDQLQNLFEQRFVAVRA